MRTKAMVVETSRRPLPCEKRVEELAAPGVVSGLARGDALGTGPPSALRRSWMYFILGAVLRRAVERQVVEVLVGHRDVEAVAELAAARSSLSFFCWCVMLRPSPASPRP